MTMTNCATSRGLWPGCPKTISILEMNYADLVDTFRDWCLQGVALPGLGGYIDASDRMW